MYSIPTNRIALISVDGDPAADIGLEEAGGQNVYVCQVGQALARVGWEVDMFTRSTSLSEPMIVNHNPHCRTIRLKAGGQGFMNRDCLFNNLPEFVREFQAFERQEKIQYSLVHTNYWLSSWVGMELKKRQPLIQVHTYHSLGAVEYQRVANPPDSADTRLAVEKACLQRVDLVVATSPQEEHYLRTLVSPEGKIDLIPCGTDLKRFGSVCRKEARHQLGIAPNAKVVLYVGRFDPRKGIDTLIEAIARSRFRGQQLHLIIAGKSRPGQSDGIEQARIENLVKKLGLDDCTDFPGRLDETLPWYYAAADVCVIPSHYEPFGLVAIEAMASRTPVVASQVGGLQFSVIPEITGLLVPPRDELGFAHAIDRILSDSEWRDELGQMGRLRTEMTFSWDGVASRLSNLYSQLLLQKRPTYNPLPAVAA